MEEGPGEGKFQRFWPSECFVPSYGVAEATRLREPQFMLVIAGGLKTQPQPPAV